jgi:uncharacterized protein YjiS (DUF1127 family)
MHPIHSVLGLRDIRAPYLAHLDDRLLADIGLRRDGWPVDQPSQIGVSHLAHLDDRLLADIGLRRDGWPVDQPSQAGVSYLAHLDDRLLADIGLRRDGSHVDQPRQVRSRKRFYDWVEGLLHPVIGAMRALGR